VGRMHLPGAGAVGPSGGGVHLGGMPLHFAIRLMGSQIAPFDVVRAA
jgi:hypothetical protein